MILLPEEVIKDVKGERTSAIGASEGVGGWEMERLV